MKDFGGYKFYSSKPALELAQWAVSLDDLDRGLQLKKIADRIERRKRKNMKLYIKCSQNHKISCRFHLLSDRPQRPPLRIGVGELGKYDRGHLYNGRKYRESKLITQDIDFKPHVDWGPPGYDWKKHIDNF